MLTQKHTGKTIAEYALILALLVLVAIPALTFLGNVLSRHYTDNKPMSKADALFALLNTKAPQNNAAPSESSGDPSAISAESGPVEDIEWQFDNGQVKVLLPDTAGGTVTTSADGTEFLARNLAQLLEEKSTMLNEEQRQEFAALSNLGFSMAQEQRRLLEAFPQFENNREAIPNIVFFSDYNDKTSKNVEWTENLYIDYRNFATRYEKLSQSLSPDDPRLADIRAGVDINASAISQIAYHNFILPQANMDAGAGRKKEMNSKLVKQVDLTQKCPKKSKSKQSAGATPGALLEQAKTDVTSIQRTDAAVVTEEASTQIKEQETRYQKYLESSTPSQ